MEEYYVFAADFFGKPLYKFLAKRVVDGEEQTPETCAIAADMETVIDEAIIYGLRDLKLVKNEVPASRFYGLDMAAKLSRPLNDKELDNFNKEFERLLKEKCE